MKTIGLLGGMSWESTASYYRIINEITKAKKGKLHSAKLVMASVDFQEIEDFQRLGQWDQAGMLLAQQAKRLELAGADFLVLCTNTMHKVAPVITQNISIPLLHIAHATANKIIWNGLNTVGLLGTRFTMEQNFYRATLQERGLKIIVPELKDRERVHDIIYKELCLGEIREASKNEYLKVITRLTQAGAEGIIAGCTEIGLLIQQENLNIPLFDTTRIHAEEAVRIATEDVCWP